MRLTQLFLTCCLLVSTLVVAQEEASAAVSSVISKIPSGIKGGNLFNTIKIDKEVDVDVETKDIIVNIGKVDIEIEKEIKKIPANGAAAAASVDSVEAAQQKNLVLPNKNKIDKEVDIKKKEIIVNIGKVKVEIEKNKHHPLITKKATFPWKPTYKPSPQLIKKPATIYPSSEAPNHSNELIEQEDATDATSTDEETTPAEPEAEAEPEPEPAAEAEPAAAEEEDVTPPPSLEDTPSSSSEGETEITPGSDGDAPTSAEDTSDDDLGFDESLLFEDFTPAAEPDLTDEVVLGENATAAAADVTVQGGEKFDERGVLILTGPQIFSVTFKIVKQKEKVITITGSDFNVTEYKPNKQREAVTFIIRGRGFVPGGGALFNEIDEVMGGTSKGGLFEFSEPRVFLGAIPLKVVKFTDTVILARFLDIEDQREFLPGTFIARVKVLHVDLKKEKKKHGPGGDIGILGGHDEKQTEIVSVGGLVLPALGAIGGSITSGPVLGVIGDDNKKKDDLSQSLLGLFSGLRFDTAVLAVQFSEKDTQKIKGAYSTLYTGGHGLGI